MAHTIKTIEVENTSSRKIKIDEELAERLIRKEKQTIVTTLKTTKRVGFIDDSENAPSLWRQVKEILRLPD